MPFLMIRNDITKVAADAIVNPANRNLLQGSGTSRYSYSIYKYPAYEVRDCCKCLYKTTESDRKSVV